MSTLSPHPDMVRSVYPDPEYVDKYVVKGSVPGDHWFWHVGARKKHRHNQKGHACVTIKVKPSPKNGFKTRGEYVVARLLLERQFGPLPSKLKISNQCGLPQCVNPAHWRVPALAPVAPWYLEVYDNNSWRLISRATGHPAGTDVVVRCQVQGVVHVARVLPHTKRLISTPLTTVCGVSADASLVVITELPITCGACL